MDLPIPKSRNPNGRDGANLAMCSGHRKLQHGSNYNCHGRSKLNTKPSMEVDGLDEWARSGHYDTVISLGKSNTYNNLWHQHARTPRTAHQTHTQHLSTASNPYKSKRHLCRLSQSRDSLPSLCQGKRMNQQRTGPTTQCYQIHIRTSRPYSL